jgi:tripartite-type tricarboxylate transporter receptor subunit TctC
MPGRIDVYFGTLPSTLALIRGGQVRALAVTSAKRSVFAPELPTIAESGVPAYDYSAWYTLYVPAKTQGDTLRKLHDDTVAALSHPQVIQRLSEIAALATPSTSVELAMLLKSDMELWAPS